MENMEKKLENCMNLRKHLLSERSLCRIIALSTKHCRRQTPKVGQPETMNKFRFEKSCVTQAASAKQIAAIDQICDPSLRKKMIFSDSHLKNGVKKNS